MILADLLITIASDYDRAAIHNAEKVFSDVIDSKPTN